MKLEALRKHAALEKCRPLNNFFQEEGLNSTVCV